METSPLDHRRIAYIYNGPWPLAEISLTGFYSNHVIGLRNLGVDVITVCRSGLESGYPYPLKCFRTETDLTNPEFWRELGCSGAVITTWHRMTDILEAIKLAGVRVLAIGESDGQVSPRDYPWATFRYSTYSQSTWRNRLGAAKVWCYSYLLKGNSIRRRIIQNVEQSDVLALGSEGAVCDFRRFLDRNGATELAARVAWVPYPISTTFCDREIATERRNRIISIGRWDSAQKNRGLLASTIRRLVAENGETEFLIVGNESQERFGSLARNSSRVRLLGAQSRDQIRDLMAECRSLLLTSRWEGAPLVANEMLAMGGTIIGTPIPSMRMLTDNGRFGQVSRGHTAGAMASAVRTEMAAWDAQERDPKAIAEHWRRLVHPIAVAARILDCLRLPAHQSALNRLDRCAAIS